MTKGKLVLRIEVDGKKAEVELRSRKSALAIRDQLNATGEFAASVQFIKELD